MKFSDLFDINNVKDKMNKSYSNTKEFIKDKAPDLKDKVNRTYKDTSQYVQNKAPEVKEHVNKTYKVTSDYLRDRAPNVNTLSLGLKPRFYKTITKRTKYGLVFAGTCAFLFGFGYAMRPIADIYKAYGEKRK